VGLQGLRLGLKALIRRTYSFLAHLYPSALVSVALASSTLVSSALAFV
jgi:hypothetical protein